MLTTSDAVRATYTDAEINREYAGIYGNRARVAMDFAIHCDSDTEALYAYLNARMAARLGAAALQAETDGR